MAATCTRTRSPQETRGECRTGLVPKGLVHSSGIRPAPIGDRPAASWTDELRLAGGAAAASSLRLYMYRPPPDMLPPARLEQLRRHLNGSHQGASTSQQSYFKLERWLWRDIPAAMWTDEPERADFFVVPHSLISFCFHPPLQRYSVRTRLKKYLREALWPWLEAIRSRWPWYNRSCGRDHLFVWVNDQGPELDNIALPQWDAHQGWKTAWGGNARMRTMMRSFVKIGYYGTLDAATASGWRDGVDIAVPQTWMRRGAADALSASAAESVKLKRAPFFFTGQEWTGTRQGCCSSGIRPWLRCALTSLAASANRTDGGADAPPVEAPSMAEAWFALAPAGHGCWSRRLFDAINQGSVPVLLATGMALPFARLLDWSSFSIDIDTESGDGRPSAALEALASGVRDPHGAGVARASAMVTRLFEVGPWLRWVAGPKGEMHSAMGLFLIELAARRHATRRLNRSSLAPPSPPAPAAAAAGRDVCADESRKRAARAAGK